MSSKLAQIREEAKVVRDLTKAHTLFVAVPVLHEADYVMLKNAQAVRVAYLAEQQEDSK